VSTAPQPGKHKGPRIARPFEILPLEVAYNQLATPPCRLHAPCRFRACEYRPSLQRAIAPARLLSSAAPDPETTAELEFARTLALAEARGVGSRTGAGAMALRSAAFTSAFTTFFWCVIAFLFTPPWPEHAPRPDETDLVPSIQIVAAACACNDPV
jgi:hypothetical protein